jgi:hypothetical protein
VHVIKPEILTALPPLNLEGERNIQQPTSNIEHPVDGKGPIGDWMKKRG